jgi:hypothetical protein
MDRSDRWFEAMFHDSDKSWGPEEDGEGESSDFSRRRFVESGVVEHNHSSVWTAGRGGRVWAVSFLERCLISETVYSLTSVFEVTFERGFHLNSLAESAFHGSLLKSIVIPSSVVVLGRDSFHQCRGLECVIFECRSRLERIGDFAFFESGLVDPQELTDLLLISRMSSTHGCAHPS